MAQLIIAFTIFGMMAFVTHIFGGGNVIMGVARADNRTEVIAQPIFNGKSVSANLKIVNHNDFDINNLRVRCSVKRQSGTTQKSISKNIEQLIKANGSIKVNNFYITIVKDFPKSIECRVADFDNSSEDNIGADNDNIGDDKKDSRKLEIK